MIRLMMMMITHHNIRGPSLVAGAAKVFDSNTDNNNNSNNNNTHAATIGASKLSKWFQIWPPLNLKSWETYFSSPASRTQRRSPARSLV